MRTKWYKDAVVYQIYPRSFCDSNGDGFGDIQGIISKLDYLKDLGINCVWLSPVYDSPQEDNGYDISNYKDIYPPFGTLKDFKQMLDEMHKRGIRLIMDLVVNHTSSQHPWFKDAISNPNSPYRDYYFIQKGKKNGKRPPNNWTSLFTGPAWERIKGTDDYYLHLFAKGQPDLNWDNPKVREEVKDILRFWLDMGVDGFRCDVITLISKEQPMKNDYSLFPLKGLNQYRYGPHLDEYLHELYVDVYSHYDTMTVGETVMTSVEQGKKLVNENEEKLDMIFNFDNTDVDNHFGVKYFLKKFKLTNLKKVYSKWQHALYGTGWNSLFIENHDQRRSSGRFGTVSEGPLKEKSAKALAATYFLMRGTPFIYEGQEIGMTNHNFKSIDEYQDIEAKNIYNLMEKYKILKPFLSKAFRDTNRDNARTPMQWDDSEYAGFSKAKPWLKVNDNYKEINAKKAIEDPNSLYHFYQKLIKYRIGNKILKNGVYSDLLPHNNKIYASKMSSDDGEILVIANFTSKKQKCKLLPVDAKYELVLTNEDRNEENYLYEYEVRVYEYKK